MSENEIYDAGDKFTYKPGDVIVERDGKVLTLEELGEEDSDGSADIHSDDTREPEGRAE